MTGRQSYTAPMKDLESPLDLELIGPSETVVISKRALEDLDGVGGLTRRFLERTVRDELLAPTDSSKIEPLEVGGEPSGHYTVSVGNFSAVFKPLDGGEAGHTRLVERVLPVNEVNSDVVRALGEPKAAGTEPPARKNLSFDL